MARIWLSHYPPGVPADIMDQARACPSLAALFEEGCARHAERIAYHSLGATLRYAELHRLAHAFAAWLQRQGVGRGDRVLLMMPNLMQYPVCLFGTWLAGAVVVNTNPLYTVGELKHQLDDSGATTVVVAENFAHVLQQALPGSAVQRVVITAVGDLLGFWRGHMANWLVRYVRKQIKTWHIPGSVRLGRVLAQGRRLSFAPPALGPDDLAALQYTGGTTGVAKGAMLTHGNLVANVHQAHAWVQPFCQGENELIVTALPLYHVFALTANCLVFFKLGASNLLVVDARDTNTLVHEMRRLRFTALTGVNTLFNALLARPDFAQLDFSALTLVLGGGMAVQEAVARHWLAVTGVPIAQAYGLTETSPAVTINPLDSVAFNGSIGLPVPSTDVAIRDNNQRLPIGEVGEICVKGPQVMAGYWQRPDETAHTFDADGWLMTGDVGRMDERGYVFLLDRKKDMILVSGFNVYPNEIESVVMGLPGVHEVVAVGVPHGAAGEAVKLFVIRSDPSLTEAQVIAYCREHLTGYKIPKYVEFRDDLPRSAVGKILRKDLRDEARRQAAAKGG